MSSSHTRSTFLASVSLLLGLSACGGGGEEANLAGACFVAYAEPSLIIASVQNAVSAASVPVVSLSNITLDGSFVDSAERTQMTGCALLWQWVDLRFASDILLSETRERKAPLMQQRFPIMRIA